MWFRKAVIKRTGDYIIIYSQGKRYTINYKRRRNVIIVSGGVVEIKALAEMVKHGTLFIIEDDSGNMSYLLPREFKALREQIEALQDERGIILARFFARGSVESKARLLRYLAKGREKDRERLLSSAKKMMGYISKIESSDDLRVIMGYEAIATRFYFSTLGSILNRYGFAGRDKKGRDLVNAMINYANAIVRAYALVSVIRAGLFPWIGYLHRPIGDRMSLVLDLAEFAIPPIAHRAVMKLAPSFYKSEYSYIDGRVIMPDWMRYRLAKLIHALMNSPCNVFYRGIRILSYEALDDMASNVSNFLRKGRKLKPIFLL